MANNNPVPPAVLEKLRKFDTPTVCNVVELFDLRPHTAGYMDARIQACYPKLPPMVGFASTATFRSSAPPSPTLTLPQVGEGRVGAGMPDHVANFAPLPRPAVAGFPELVSPAA